MHYMPTTSKTFTIDDIRSWNPCYGPRRHLPEKWCGTVTDILKHTTIPPEDMIWVVCREELIDAKTLRLFAVWCVRHVEHLLTDVRSKNALVVAESYAYGNTDKATLINAWDAAMDAAKDDEDNPAREAAWSTVMYSARDAAMYAAWTTTRYVTWDAKISKLIEMTEAHDDNNKIL